MPRVPLPKLQEMFGLIRRFFEWIAPSPPAGDDVTEAWVQFELVQHTAHLVRVVSLLTPVTAASFALLLWGRADALGLVAWCGLAIVASAGVYLASCRVSGSLVEPGSDLSATVASGPARYDITPLAVALMFSGTCWGSLTVLAMPYDTAWQSFTGILVIAPMAVNAIFDAAVAKLFWSFQLAIAAMASIGYLMVSDSTSIAVLLVVLYSLPFSAVLARINRAAVARAAFFAVAARRKTVELSQLNEHLSHEASHDPLTRLANRAEFTDQLQSRFAKANPGTIGLLFIDLDRFKIINDSWGHGVGDELLCAVADRIENHTRSGELVARIGGDEFIVLVDSATSTEELRHVGERILKGLEQPFIIRGRECRTGASIGVASNAMADTPSDLMRAADAALYEAKDHGRGVVRVFDEKLRDAIDRRLDDENDVRTAIHEGQISGWFQPIVAFATGEIVGAEALARWGVDGVFRPAGQFMQMVEDIGLEAELSKIVSRDIRRMRAGLRERGIEMEFGLNVPPGYINEVLDEFRLDQDLRGLTLEITETGLIADLDDARERLNDARARGAKVWLDDFGQGQSSLSLLTALPLDGVKIDKAFVNGMMTDSMSKTIVVAIAEIGQSMGLDVIAEGVETVAQAEALRHLGVTHSQGFLVAPALEPAGFTEMVLNHRSCAGLLGLDLLGADER